MFRDHEPIVLEEFNGLWKRGDEDSCPQEYFTDENNIQSIESGFETRDGLDTLLAQGNVLRIYNYKLQTGESLIILDTNGDIYHAIPPWTSPTVHGPVLHVTGMTDFAFFAFAGRAYISPFGTFIDSDGKNYQKGLQNQVVYVYKGDGTAARAAAGNPPTLPGDTPMVAFNSTIDGKINQGIHVFAATFSDGVGDSTGLGPTILPVIYAPGGKEAIINNIPIGPLGITQRKIWATVAIDPKDWNPDTTTYTYFLVKTVLNNTDTATTVSFADTELTVPFVAGALANPTSGGINAKNSAVEGHSDLGLHIIGVVYETDTGFLTAPGPEVFAVQSFVNVNKAIDIANIPTSPDPFVIKRHLVSSRAITDYNGDDRGYQLYFIPDGTIENNADTTKTVSYYDLDLIEDASYLLDNFASIPAGAVLSSYNNRMILAATFTDISLAYLSAPGEPEAIDQVDGQIIVPLDGNPITNAQEFRDVLYLYKKTRTYMSTDNGDVPSTWAGPVPLDQGIGTSVYGIAQVLDSGGVNVEYLIVVYFGGIYIFNGVYTEIPLTWVIEDFWEAIDRNDFGNIQIMNDTLNKKLYITLPNRQLLLGQYDDGLTPKDIKWHPWSFDIETTTIALIQTDTLVIGSEQVA
jgi:hypothetical protein